MVSTNTVLIIKPTTPRPRAKKRTDAPHLPALDRLARSHTIKAIKPIKPATKTVSEIDSNVSISIISPPKMVSYYKNSLAQKGTGVKKRYNNGGEQTP